MSDIISSCDLYKKLTEMTLLNKDSASNTEIIAAIAKVNNQNKKVIAKIFPNILDFSMNYTYDQIQHRLNILNTYLSDHIPGVSGLIYEMAVYNLITENILNRNYSQNFVRCLGSGYCDYDILGKDLGNKLARSYGIKYAEDLKRVKDFFNPLKVGITFTEKVGNAVNPITTFGEFIEGSRGNAYKKQVIFQIVHALAVMGEFDIQHNDLHSGNILIEELKREKSFIYYSASNQAYTIRTKYIPYIFDWDFAYVESLGDNKKLLETSHCRDTNICNVFDPYFDLYTLFCTVDMGDVPEYLQNIYKSVYNNENGSNFLYVRKNAINFMLRMSMDYPDEYYSYGKNLRILVLNDRKKIESEMKGDRLTNKNLKGDVLVFHKDSGIIKEGIFLNASEYQKIQERGIHITDNVYKFNPDELLLCLGEEKYYQLFFYNILSVVVRVFPVDILGYSAVLEKSKGYPCRPTEYTSGMPLPVDLLDTGFNNFISTEAELKSIEDVFYFPNNGAELKIPQGDIYIFPKSQVLQSSMLLYNPDEKKGAKNLTKLTHIFPVDEEEEEEELILSPEIFQEEDVPLGKPQEPPKINVYNYPRLQSVLPDTKKPPPPFKFNPSQAMFGGQQVVKPVLAPVIKPVTDHKDMVEIDLFGSSDNKSNRQSNKSRGYKPSSRATAEFVVNNIKQDSGYDIVNYDNDDQAIFVLDEDQNFSVNT